MHQMQEQRRSLMHPQVFQRRRLLCIRPLLRHRHVGSSQRAYPRQHKLYSPFSSLPWNFCPPSPFSFSEAGSLHDPERPLRVATRLSLLLPSTLPTATAHLPPLESARHLSGPHGKPPSYSGDHCKNSSILASSTGCMPCSKFKSPPYFRGRFSTSTYSFRV